MWAQMDALIYSSVAFYPNVDINDKYLVKKMNPLIHGNN